MRTTIGQKTRLIEVTEANIRNGHLYLTGHLGFFPAASFGASSKKGALGQLLTLEVEGLPEPVQTDIPTEFDGGAPRRFFRNRTWVSQFFRANKVQPGDFIRLQKMDRFRVRVTRASEEEVLIHRELVSRRERRKSAAVEVGSTQVPRIYKWPTTAPKAEYHASHVTSALENIRAVDWSRFRIIDLFAGIGGIRLGFEQVGGKSVFSSEWDELAATTYEANFGERPHGDITKVSPSEVPDHEILLAGFPCQPFSIIGDRKGFGDTRGTLFFNVEEILRVKRPLAALLENVKQFKTHDDGRTFRTVVDRLSKLGYHTHTAILNALHYGVPQKRERTFIVCFRANLDFQFPEPNASMARLEDVLEPDNRVDPKYFASDRIQAKRLQRLREQGGIPFYPSVWHENKGGAIGIHPFSCALRHNASHNYLLVNGRRRLTPRESLRLQGFPDSYKIVVDHRAIRAQTGNSVAVPVIQAIARQMLTALREAKPKRTELAGTDLFADCV